MQKRHYNQLLFTINMKLQCNEFDFSSFKRPKIEDKVPIICNTINNMNSKNKYRAENSNNKNGNENNRMTALTIMLIHNYCKTNNIGNSIGQLPRRLVETLIAKPFIKEEKIRFAVCNNNNEKIVHHYESNGNKEFIKIPENPNLIIFDRMVKAEQILFDRHKFKTRIANEKDREKFYSYFKKNDGDDDYLNKKLYTIELHENECNKEYNEYFAIALQIETDFHIYKFHLTSQYGAKDLKAC